MNTRCCGASELDEIPADRSSKAGFKEQAGLNLLSQDEMIWMNSGAKQEGGGDNHKGREG
jgi:hypothetical protein